MQNTGKKKIKKMKNSLVIQGDRIKILSILKTWTLTYSPNPKTVFSQEHGLWKWHKLEQIRIFYTVNDKQGARHSRSDRKHKRSKGKWHSYEQPLLRMWLFLNHWTHYPMGRPWTLTPNTQNTGARDFKPRKRY